MKRAWDIEKFVVINKEFSLVNQTTKQNVAGKPFYKVEIKDSIRCWMGIKVWCQSGKISERKTRSAVLMTKLSRKTWKWQKWSDSHRAYAHPGTVQEVKYEIENNGDLGDFIYKAFFYRVIAQASIKPIFLIQFLQMP